MPTKGVPDQASLLAGLRLTITLGAMRADATVEQRRQLRDWYNVRQYDLRSGRITLEQFEAGFRAVMGLDWQPTGEWQTALDKLK